MLAGECPQNFSLFFNCWSNNIHLYAIGTVEMLMAISSQG